MGGDQDGVRSGFVWQHAEFLFLLRRVGERTAGGRFYCSVLGYLK